MKLRLFIILLFISRLGFSQSFIVDDTYKVEELVLDHFIKKNHAGIFIKDIHYKGLTYASGYFQYKSKFNDLPSDGIVLSTGRSKDAMGPNNNTSSNENHVKGDLDLSEITKSKSFDAAAIEFNFMSLTDSISFTFQFASEEYPEYVNRGVSDIFGFFVTNLKSSTSQNIAVLPNSTTPITIDLINEDVNSDYFVINYPSYSQSRSFYETSNLFMFDGFTKPIQTGLKLLPYNWYHFKIVITDIGDRRFDSWIFLKGNSFVSDGKKHDPDSTELKAYLSELDDFKLYNLKDSIKVEIPVFFSLNSYSLNDTTLTFLQKINTVLEYSNYNLKILGFADKSGSEEYNQQLSLNRAQEVMEYFINQGINSDRLEAIGKGETLFNTNLEKSRKVEFILY